MVKCPISEGENKKIIKLKKVLVVFTPGMVALSTAEESDLRFISTSQLSEPPFCQIMAAVRAGYLHCRLGADVFIAVDNKNIIFLHVGNFFHLFFRIFRDDFFITAFCTGKPAVFGFHELPALWTEHHTYMLVIHP